MCAKRFGLLLGENEVFRIVKAVLVVSIFKSSSVTEKKTLVLPAEQ